MSKRKNHDEIVRTSKQKKPKKEDPNENVPVDIQNRGSLSPAIFKLHAICCDDWFEWLSFEDLHSLGQTCKRMHRLIGLYFQNNFSKTFSCKKQHIYEINEIYEGRVRLDGFIQFAQSITFERRNNDKDYQYIGTNCYSLRKIHFDEVELNKRRISHIKPRLKNIETIEINFHKSK